MPRPEQTPTPAVRRGEGLPQGAASEVESLLSAIPLPPDDDLDFEDEEEFSPQGAEEQFLFGPSDRPNEPITAGAPFGPGPNIPLVPRESEREFLARVASTLEAESGSVPGVRSYIARIKRGF